MWAIFRSHAPRQIHPAPPVTPPHSNTKPYHLLWRIERLSLLVVFYRGVATQKAVRQSQLQMFSKSRQVEKCLHSLLCVLFTTVDKGDGSRQMGKKSSSHWKACLNLSGQDDKITGYKKAQINFSSAVFWQRLDGRFIFRDVTDLPFDICQWSSVLQPVADV